MGKELAQSLEPEVPREEIEQAAEETPQETPQENPEERSTKEREAEEAADPAAKAAEVQKNLNAALREERQKRKELEGRWRQEAAERQQRDQLLQDRLNQLWASQNQGPQLRDPKTDPDPLDALAHNQNLALQAMQQMHHRQATEDARARQQQQVQSLVGWARAQAAEFAQETPEFGEAYSYVVGNRRAELEALGYQGDNLLQALHNDELMVYQQAAQTGRNPAEIIYTMAKNTGFKRVEPKQPKEVAEQKIETLQKGLAASKDLSGGATGKPTAEQIANMSEEEFAELKAKLKKQGKSLSDVI